MDELLAQFVVEGRELTQAATDDLLALERTPGDASRIDSAFRAFHTLKGSTGLFDFGPMGEVLHAAEDLMTALRAGTVGPDRAVLDALLGASGATEAWIDCIAATGRLPDGIADQVLGLTQALRAPLGQTAATATIAPASDAAWLHALRVAHAQVINSADRPLTALRYTPQADCFSMGDDPLALVRAVPDLLALAVTPRGAFAVPFDPFTCNLVIELVSGAPPETLRGIFRLVGDQIRVAPLPSEDMAGTASSLRVDVSRIDALGDIVGELIVANNALAHQLAALGRTQPELARPLAASQARFDRLVGQMHRGLSAIRMIPLSQSLRRLPPTMRELGGKLGKQFDFVMSGAATEADKAVADALFEPLLHLLRNAADHGIEPEAVRVAAGKPAEGGLSLAITRHAERLVLVVRDDGGGIDPEIIRAAAIERGLLNAEATLGDAAVLDLVFSPGFSTAAAVTETSGRGVGLDAVRAAIAALGGSVGIASTKGVGTTVEISVPQAAALSTIVLVEAGGERFGVPIEAVGEAVRVAAAAIRPVRHGAATVYRGRTLPVLRLTEALGLPAAPPAPHCTLLVTQGDPPTAILVDRFGERLAVVLRPLAGLLAGLRFVLGSALLGDGSVVLVLNLAEMTA